VPSEGTGGPPEVDLDTWSARGTTGVAVAVGRAAARTERRVMRVAVNFIVAVVLEDWKSRIRDYVLSKR